MIAQIRKALVAAVALLAQLVAAGTLSGTALAVASGVLALAGALGVYRVPNEPAVAAHPHRASTAGHVKVKPKG